MPVIIEPGGMHERRGEGWEETVLADAASIGAPAMTARRLRLGPGAAARAAVHEEGAEQFLYVVSGAGVAAAGDERWMLERETVVWAEPGDEIDLEAGPEGIEVLIARAPAE